MHKIKRPQGSAWIGLAFACALVTACGGDDEPVAGSDSTTPAPGPAPAPAPTTPGPGPAPAPPPVAEPDPGPPPAPVTGTGLSSECLSRDLFENASTWKITVETSPADGSAKKVATTNYNSTPGVSSPAGPGTRLFGDVTFDDGAGTISNFEFGGFVQLDGNLVNQYELDITDNGTVIDAQLEFTDPSFDLALNESRTLPKNGFGGVIDITYTYLGQEAIRTALGGFTACKFTQDSRAANATFNNTYWFSVGTGLLLKSESESELLGRSLGIETEELVKATINGTAVTGN